MGWAEEAILAVSYPGAGIDGRGGHLMGGGVTKTGDFVIGHTGCSDFPSAKLASGNGSKRAVPIQGLLPMLPKEGIADRDRLSGYLKKEAAIRNEEFTDTDWDGIPA